MPDPVWTGPWVGELGWACLWHAYVRAQAAGRPIVHVGDPDLAALWPDLDVTTVPYPFPPGVPCGLSSLSVGDPAWRDLDARTAWLRAQAGDAPCLIPDPTWSGRWTHAGHGAEFAYVRYQATDTAATPPVLIHARARLDLAPERNDTMHDLLAAGLAEDPIGAIGHPQHAAHPAGTTDLRGVPLAAVLSHLCRADVVVGPSSGPLVLALLCDTPVVTWGSPSVAHRFHASWNPWKTPAVFLPGRPTPEQVRAAIAKVRRPRPLAVAVSRTEGGGTAEAGMPAHVDPTAPPLTVVTYPGIGDFSWVYSLLWHVPRPLRVHYQSDARGDKVSSRLEPLLDLLPQVVEWAPVRVTEAAIKAAPAPTWAAVTTQASIVMGCNTHLEAGRPLATYAPEFPPPNFHYPLAIPAEDVAEAERLVGRLGPFLCCYTSSLQTARAWKGWGPSEWDGFCTALRRTMDEGPVPLVFVGAPYDRSIIDAMETPQVLDLVGATRLGVTIEILRRAAHFLAFPSGLAVLATVIRAPVTMFYPDVLTNGTPSGGLQTSWAPPEAQRTGQYTPILFEPPGIVARRVAALLAPAQRRSA